MPVRGTIDAGVGHVDKIGAVPALPVRVAIHGVANGGEGIGRDLREGADTVTLGAVAALGSGAAVTVGPMTMGILSDAVGIRSSILIVPVLAVAGAFACLPSRQHARA